MLKNHNNLPSSWCTRLTQAVEKDVKHKNHLLSIYKTLKGEIAQPGKILFWTAVPIKRVSRKILYKLPLQREHLGELVYTFVESNLFKSVCLLFEKGSTLKGKFAPTPNPGSKFFHFSVNVFSEEESCAREQTGSNKCCFPWKMVENLPNVSILLKYSWTH